MPPKDPRRTQTRSALAALSDPQVAAALLMRLPAGSLCSLMLSCRSVFDSLYSAAHFCPKVALFVSALDYDNVHLVKSLVPFLYSRAPTLCLLEMPVPPQSVPYSAIDMDKVKSSNLSIRFSCIDCFPLPTFYTNTLTCCQLFPGGSRMRFLRNLEICFKTNLPEGLLRLLETFVEQVAPFIVNVTVRGVQVVLLGEFLRLKTLLLYTGPTIYHLNAPVLKTIVYTPKEWDPKVTLLLSNSVGQFALRIDSALVSDALLHEKRMPLITHMYLPVPLLMELLNLGAQFPNIKTLHVYGSYPDYKHSSIPLVPKFPRSTSTLVLENVNIAYGLIKLPLNLSTLKIKNAHSTSNQRFVQQECKTLKTVQLTNSHFGLSFLKSLDCPVLTNLVFKDFDRITDDDFELWGDMNLCVRFTNCRHVCFEFYRKLSRRAIRLEIEASSFVPNPNYIALDGYAIETLHLTVTTYSKICGLLLNFSKYLPQVKKLFLLLSSPLDFCKHHECILTDHLKFLCCLRNPDFAPCLTYVRVSKHIFQFVSKNNLHLCLLHPSLDEVNICQSQPPPNALSILFSRRAVLVEF